MDRGAYYALLGLFEPEERALFESGGDRGLRVDGSGVGAGYTLGSPLRIRDFSLCPHS